MKSDSNSIKPNQYENYAEGLEHVKKDEQGFLGLNNIQLLSYKLISKNESKTLGDFNNSKTVLLKRKDFETQGEEKFDLKLANDYQIKVAQNSNKGHNDFINKKREFIAQNRKTFLNYDIVKIEWLIEGEEYTTEAFFNKGELIYDDIISNYLILTEGSTENKPKMKETSNSKNSSDCPPNGSVIDIDLTRRLYHTLSDTFHGEIAEANSSIYFTGTQSPGDCTKTLNTYDKSVYAVGSSYGVAEANANIIRFNPYDSGFCEYAIALQAKHPWESITLTLNFMGGSFQVSSTSNTSPVVFQEEGGYITGDNLN